MSDFEDDSCSQLETKFNQAAQHLQKIHSKLSSSDLLEFYGLYKQSTIGKCGTSKPGMFSGQARAKWNAWNSLGDVESSKAMELYVAKLTEIVPDWDKNEPKEHWVSVSVYQQEPEKEILDTEKTVFDYVKEMNLQKLQQIVARDSIDQIDDGGLGLIHWATDRNAVEILNFLLVNGADINLRDSEGQTALHYASSCGHMDCIKLLIKFGADKSIIDNEGNTCLDVTFDTNVKELLQS